MGHNVVLLALSLLFISIVLSDDAPLVEVDFFVMSRCPDAQVCEEAFAETINEVGSIVDLRVNYIGKQKMAKEY